MTPSVRIRRRHAYASIRDEERLASERLLDQPERGRRALSEGTSTLSPTAASESVPIPRESAPSSTPHDTTRLAPGYFPARSDTSRVNRHVRTSSFSHRSIATDLDSNISNSPPATFSRLSNFPPPHEIIYEGPNTEVVVPGPHRGHGHKTSRVQSALSTSPSRAGPDSDSDSDIDSEDEDGIMEDDEHHHDDDVVDHLDVIGPHSRIDLSHLNSVTLPFNRPASRHRCSTHKHSKLYPHVRLLLLRLNLPTDTLSNLAHLSHSTLANLSSSFRAPGESRS
jgi:hypothetical protein